jgi:pSer/pThr/pTyr-binding forkhead associated (FHA) protein
LSLRPELFAIVASTQPARATEADDVLLLRGHRVGDAIVQARVVELPQIGSVRTGPTHVLWNAEVKPLIVDSVVEIGRSVTESGVSLPEGLAGVSRWHCSLRVSSLSTELIDHSRHGTWLNDERVLGRAEVFTGDRIRIGDPGIELTLLAIETVNGAPAR